VADQRVTGDGRTKKLEEGGERWGGNPREKGEGPSRACQKNSVEKQMREIGGFGRPKREGVDPCNRKSHQWKKKLIGPKRREI